MNKDKTKVIWIGKTRNSKDKINTVPKLSWGETGFNLLGLDFDINLDKMTEANYDKYLKQMDSIINHWNKRYLTPFGKITVIKTYLISKLIHIFTALPTPNITFIKKINRKLFNFLWDGKPDKINRTQICQLQHVGGLKMIDIDTFILSLKISWIKRLISSDKQPWAVFFDLAITSKYNLFNFGTSFINNLIPNLKNNFLENDT